MTTLEHATERGRVMEQIALCDDCALRDDCNGPVPFRGPSPNRIMVLGEAPGAEEDRGGKPFVGPAGKYLERALAEQGIVLKTLFVANAVCCRARGAPDAEFVDACNRNLRAQLRLCDPDWVLALGGTALNTVTRGQITKLRGRTMSVPAGPFIGRWVFPTFHPAAVLRQPDQYATKFHSDLSTFALLIAGRLDPQQIAVRFGRGGKVVV